MKKQFKAVAWGMLMLVAMGGVAEAATCTSKANGNWNAAGTWTCIGAGAGTIPQATDAVIIQSPHIVQLNNNYSVATLTINSGGTLADNGNDLTVTGNVVVNGTYDGTGNNGNLIMTGGAGTTLSGTGTFIDIKRIQIDGSVTMPTGSNLTLTLQSELRVNGTLNLNGTISGTGQTAGNRILRVDNAPATINIGNTGVVDAPNAVAEVKSGGTLNNAGSVTLNSLTVQGTGTWTNTGGSCNVPNQTPAGTCLSGVAVALTAASTNPATTGSNVNWTATFSQPVTGVTAANFALVPGGVTGAAITSVTGAGTIWTVVANSGSGFGTLGLNMVNATGIAPAVTSAMPVVGAVYSIDAPMTCVTDNFATGVLDSTLWSVATVSGAFTPAVVNVGGGDNRLRLTSVGGNQSTVATMKRSFPGAGNKIVLEVDYFAYGGTGADGIAVTFSNAAVAAIPGGFGGSLGYAQRTGGINGFAGGWLGIGLDEFGNYPNSTEGRLGYPAGWVAPAPANKAAGFYTTNVAVRGSGTGVTGYNLLANTGVLTPAVNPASGAAGATPYRYRFTIDHSSGTNAWVQVERDTTAPLGDAYTMIVPQFDAKASPSQVAVPASWQLSFTGSTGGSTNNHEFKQVRVCANTILGGGPHHFEITHADGQGVTCTPSTLTIKACADAAVPCTPYTAGVSGSLSATGTPTVNWGGSNAFSIAAGNSTVTKNIQVTTVGSVTLDAASTPTPTAASTCTWGACSFSSANSALLVSAPNHLAESVSTLTIQAVKAAAGNPLVCVPGMTGNKTVNLKCAYTNPASGTLPVRVGGTALNAGNNVVAACDGGGANVSLTFNGLGIATSSLQYADVGEMSVSAGYTGVAGSIDAGLVMTGSGSFITAPASFSVTGVTAGPIKAGTAFSATVTALNAAGVAAPNLGNETAPEGATLSSVLAMGPGTWVNPALGGTTAIPGTSFVNGVATVSNLTWSEVGAINLRAALTSGNYLTSVLTTLPGTTTASTTFIPDHYATEIVSASGVPMTCPDVSCPANTLGVSGMVYSGQPFTVRVTAKNLTSTTTTNYQGAYAQDVTLSGVGVSGSLSNPLLLASKFALGAATTISLPAFTFSAVGPAVPSDISIHAIGTGDASTIVSSGADESALKVVYGRIKISNAYGSELLPISLTATAQYYGTSGWTNSLTDNATIVGLASTYAVVPATGTAGSTTPTPQNGVVTGGQLSIKLSKPGTKGVATITPSAHVYMKTLEGTATFGVYKGANEFIYLRESY